MIAVHIRNKRVEVRKVRRPPRPDGFALIRLLYAGICNTDLELQRGYYGFSGIPGHEFVGEVVEADSPHLVGRRVVGEINLACQKCEWCLKGLGRHCPKRKVLGIVGHPGAFREFLTLPEVNLHVVPPSIPSEAAVFVEPLAAAYEILDQARIPEGADVAVLGDGKLGLLIAQVLNVEGKRVCLFGRHKDKLRMVEGSGVSTMVATKKIVPDAYDWVVDATGSVDGLRQAIEMVRPRGTVFLKSTIHQAIHVDAARVVVNEITLVGSRCGRFEPAISLLQSAKVNVVDMISELMPLSQARRGFARAREAGVLKVLLSAE